MSMGDRYRTVVNRWGIREDQERNRFQCYGTPPRPVSPWISHQASLIDINGDGAADLIFRGSDNRFWISLADGKGGLLYPAESIRHGGPFLADQVYFADINGDGASDLISRGSDNRFWI